MQRFESTSATICLRPREADAVLKRAMFGSRAIGAIQTVRTLKRGEEVPKKAYESVQGGGGSSKNVGALV